MTTSNATPGHSALDNLEARDNQLVFAGRSVAELAELAGRTPFYAYDRDRMSARVAALRAALPDFVHLHYAMKANPHPDVVSHFASLVDGLDVASGGELRIALESGMRPELISFAGPGKRQEELRDAIGEGIVINAESATELQRIDAIGRAVDITPKVAIRVNPDFELKTSGMKMSGGPKQFGIDAEQVPEVLSQFRDLKIEFQGFHVFSGSQNLKPEAICETQSKTIDLAIHLSQSAPGPVKILNIGGGFGIPYFPGDTPLDLSAISSNLRKLERKIAAALPDAEIVIELGRYLVGEAGIYVCRVLDRKISRGHIFLVTDGGLHHHLAASGNFGQVLRKNYPVVVGTRVAAGPEPIAATAVGPLCTPLDLLADRMNLGHADIDDLIVVLQSGAYGYSASPHRFLSHPEPVEICI